MTDQASSPAVIPDRHELDIPALIFSTSEPPQNPTLILLTGQPGAGRSRASGRILVDHSEEVAVLSVDELRTLHSQRAFWSPASFAADQDEAADVARWLGDGIRYARESRRSLLLDGPLNTPSVAWATADRFAAAGFQTRVVIVAARHAESLLALVSASMRAYQAGRRPQPVDLAAHERGWAGTLGIAAEADESAPVDRITVLGRAGEVVFDAVRNGSDRPFRGVRAALAGAQAARLTSLQAVQWFSELRSVTEYARSLRQPPPVVVEALIELHELALREMVPELPVLKGSKMVAAQELRHASELVALRKLVAPAEQPVHAPGPVVAPSAPERGGVSR